jgi:hypothetical protein
LAIRNAHSASVSWMDRFQSATGSTSQRLLLSQLGAFDEALQVARRIDQKKFQVPGQVDATWALCRISLSQAKAGNLDAARATLREATRVGPHPGADAKQWRGSLAFDFVVIGGLDEAREIAETLDPGSRADILSLVARQKLRDGDLKSARFFVRRALKDADQDLNSPPPPRGPEPPRGPGPLAVDVGEGGTERLGATDPEAEHRAGAFSSLALIHARAGDWSSAAKAFASIPPSPNDQLRHSTALWIASLRARSGDVAGSLDWALSLPSPALRAWAIRGLAAAIFDKEGAEQL